jgi:copper transport protein
VVEPTDRSRRLLAIAAAVALIGVATLAPVVSAHAVLSETDPQQGGHVEDVPETITLTYTGDGVDEILDVTVTGPDGREVTGHVYKDGEVATEVFVDVTDAGEGVYVVEWEIQSTDTHVVRGSWFFTVGEAALDPATLLASYEADDRGGGTVDTDPEYAQVLPTGLLYLAVVALLGMPVALVAALRPVADRSDMPRRVVDATVRRLLTGAAVVAAGATGVLLLASVRAADGTGVAEAALASRTGRVLLGQFVVAAGAASVLSARTLRDPAERESNAAGGRAWLGAAALAGLLLAAGQGATSHAASQVGLPVGTTVTLGHFVGVAVWAGGLFAVAVALPAALRRTAPGERRAAATRVVRRFSVLAVAGVTLLVATGLGLTAWLVPSPAAFLRTLHGSVLGVKLSLVVVALGLGARSRYVLLERLDPTTSDPRRLLARLPGGDRLPFVGPRRRPDGSGSDPGPVRAVVGTVRLEAAVVVCVLLVSGLLTATVPGVVAGVDDGPGAGNETVPVDAEGLEAELEIVPARGTDRGLAVTDGTPVVARLELRSDDGDPIELESTERVLAEHAESGTTLDPELEPMDAPGTYAAVLLFPETGAWDVRLNVWTGEAFLDDSVVVHNEPAGAPDGDGAMQDDSRDGTSPFGFLLQSAAVGVGLVGLVATGREGLRIARRGE